MDYLAHVQEAIEYVEKNLDQEIKASDVAREVAFSMYHFHRIFLAVVGQTLTGYIRRRRLTEAAFKLVETKNKVIDIAFDYQFETPESFSRAFKKMYGITPGQYRKKRSHLGFLHQTKIDETILRRLNGGMTMEPKIIIKDEFIIVGMRYYGENRNNEIPQLWDRFIPRIHEIKNHINRELSYGICYPTEDESQNGEFEYIAAVEVGDLDEIPDGMVMRTVPTQKYAVFVHKGPADKIKETYGVIYGTLLPKLGYDFAKAPDFEYYDDRFDEDNQETSELDIYIPIK
ncbi:GyrI-like domain-containing protein [Thermodesulfobacteriota bacterium]